MKLKTIKIERFRSIECIEISITDLSVLIGENNSGKSNVLKAIALFYSDSVKGIDDEYFYFKNIDLPISIIMTFSDLSDSDKKEKVLKNWICNDNISIKKTISFDKHKSKFIMELYGWQATPKDIYLDLLKFDEYKSDLSKNVKENNLPDYFKTDKGKVTQTSYKDGLKIHFEKGSIEMGDPNWIKNPGGYKEVFSSLLPQFYLVPAVKDAQDESKTSQQTVFGKLITDLTNRIVEKNPKFEEVKEQINGLKKFLNKNENGDDSNRLKEIIELESNISELISENMPESKVEIEIITPELIDLFKDTKIKLDDSLITSIGSKGHGLQRALIFSFIRVYAKQLNKKEVEGQVTLKNFILGIEEPELFLHPNGQRKMLSVLSNISSSDQVIFCTHSNFFVNMFNYKDLIIVKTECVKHIWTFFEFKLNIIFFLVFDIIRFIDPDRFR